MSGWSNRRPSPAMVVAVVALIVALAGSAYAGSKLNGKKLVNRSVAAKKIKKNSLGGKVINEAKVSGVSAATLTGVRYVSETAPINQPRGAKFFGSTQVACPKDLTGTRLKVMGGGASTSFIDEPGEYVLSDGPSGDEGWFASAVANDPSTVKVTAICARLAS